MDPKDYDVLLRDMNEKTLGSEVVEFAGVPYLQKATKDEANKVVEIGNGFSYSLRSCNDISMRCQLPTKGSLGFLHCG